MNKSDLIQRLGSETGLSLTEAGKFVTLVFSEMSEALAKGERIEIRGIGSFKIKHYDGYTGVNPKTLEAVEVRPKKLPFFKCGREMKKRLNPEKV